MGSEESTALRYFSFIAGINIQITALVYSQVCFVVYGGGAAVSHLLKSAIAHHYFKLLIKHYPIKIGFRFAATGSLCGHKTGEPSIQTAAAVLQFCLCGFTTLFSFQKKS